MRVLVNALPLRVGGGVAYLRQQLEAMARVAPDIQLHTLLSPWTEVDEHELPGYVEVVPVRSVATRFGYEQLRLPWRRPDVLYCPANFAPLVSRAPTVLTIHNPHYYGSGLEVFYTRSLRPPAKVWANHLAMRRVDAVVGISHAQAREALATVPRVANKLRVIQSGAPSWPAESEKVPGIPERYVLTVSNGALHKRVQDVVEGWATALDVAGGDVALVIAGRVTDAQITAYRTAAGRHHGRLVLLGPVRQRAQLKYVYERAMAMISMSELEAFPLTPSEAGSVGCPLVLSDIPPHREVSLNNGTFVAVGDLQALAQVLSRGFQTWEPGSRPWMWPLTWDDNARALIEVFEEVRGLQTPG